MALTKRSETRVVYLEVKHYCLWRALKKQEAGCDSVEVNNPSTGNKVVKYGYRFDTVSGRVVKLVKYDTERKYSTRYFGFKLHLVDGDEIFVLDMPYKSQILRRFLRVAHNVDWALPLSITIFKGNRREGQKDGAEETGVWFQQKGETTKPYYTKDALNGAPDATWDDTEKKWDFTAQHRFLVQKLQDVIIPEIEEAAKVSQPDDEPEALFPESTPEEPDHDDPPANAWNDLDEVPF